MGYFIRAPWGKGKRAPLGYEVADGEVQVPLQDNAVAGRHGIESGLDKEVGDKDP